MAKGEGQAEVNYPQIEPGDNLGKSRQDLEDRDDAIRRSFAGAEPGDKVVGQLWLDLDSRELKMYVDADPTDSVGAEWIVIASYNEALQGMYIESTYLESTFVKKVDLIGQDKITTSSDSFTGDTRFTGETLPDMLKAINAAFNALPEIHSGSAEPSADVGKNGDIYVRTNV